MTKPTIAVIGGTGAEGSGLAIRWAAAGYPVIIGSRSAERAAASAAEFSALLPEGGVPPLREHPLIISLVAVLGSGILAGPAGQTIRTSGDLPGFFDSVRAWYGHVAGLETEYDSTLPTYKSPTFESNPTCPAELTNVNLIPARPTLEDFDLGLTSPTHFSTYDVYVPWISWVARNRLPANYAIDGITIYQPDEFETLDFSNYLAPQATTSGLVSLVGPNTSETNGYVPLDAKLPHTIHFQNDPQATTYTNEVRIVIPIDEQLQGNSFRLGDLQVGDISIHIPAGRGLFQGDFDFTQARSAKSDRPRGERTVTGPSLLADNRFRFVKISAI